MSDVLTRLLSRYSARNLTARAAYARACRASRKRGLVA